MRTQMIHAVDLTAAHIGATIDADVPGLVADHLHGVIEQYTVSAEHVGVRVAAVHDDRDMVLVPEREQEFRHEDRIRVTTTSAATGPERAGGSVHISADGGSVAAHSIAGHLVVGGEQPYRRTIVSP